MSRVLVQLEVRGNKGRSLFVQKWMDISVIALPMAIVPSVGDDWVDWIDVDRVIFDEDRGITMLMCSTPPGEFENDLQAEMLKNGWEPQWPAS